MKLFVLLFILELTGCSTIAIRDPIKDQSVSSMDLDWCVKSTSELNIIDDTASVEENQTEFDKRIKLAVEDIANHLLTQDMRGVFLERTKMDNCEAETEDSKNPSRMLLVIELSGYGSIKKKWKRVLISTGVVEALVQGVVVSSATQNPWLGIAVAAEEMTSEYLTWNGVDWILGEAYAPVTLEGLLSYQGKPIWKDSYFIPENEDELTKNERRDKSKQLMASLHKAERKLLDSLRGYIQTEVVRKQDEPLI